jgi:hypothetical protein
MLTYAIVYVSFFMSKKQNNRIGANNNFSISRKLRSEGKTSEEFEVMLNNLSLEELISLKLELASKIMRGNLFGFPIIKAMPSITRDALITFALSATKNLSEAASLLGITVQELKKYNLDSIINK